MRRTPVVCEALEGRRLLSGFTPSQLRTAYGFDQITFNHGSVTGNGAGQTIALIETYNDMTLNTDLTHFDTAYGLNDPGPTWSLNVVGEDGGAPPLAGAVGSAALETALDVEWAHALAPAANILVIEAQSGEDSDLYAAINHASSLKAVSVVSISYVRGELATDPGDDTNFTTPANHVGGITFV